MYRCRTVRPYRKYWTKATKESAAAWIRCRRRRRLNKRPTICRKTKCWINTRVCCCRVAKIPHWVRIILKFFRSQWSNPVMGILSIIFLVDPTNENCKIFASRRDADFIGATKGQLSSKFLRSFCFFKISNLSMKQSHWNTAKNFFASNFSWEIQNRNSLSAMTQHSSVLYYSLFSIDTLSIELITKIVDFSHR